MIPAPGGGAAVPGPGSGRPAQLRLKELHVGPLLAEGGEGRVYLLPRQPHLLYKAYRRPVGADHLDALTAWPTALEREPAARVTAAAAWPSAVVTGRSGQPAGLLVPRAPRRFSVRHRDGHSRLATLSYLTADPGHRAAAYGLELPAPAGPARTGLVYALARLLDAFQSAPEPVGHGDLSTKNVLWSLQRGPEVFVIDCDNAEIFGPDGLPVGAGRRRAMTPNWDDPAVPRGSNPTLASDRYSLALVFLRLVGAANFPIQARQRSGEPVSVEFPVANGPGSRALLDPEAPVWDLAGRSLSVRDPEGRPPPGAWLPVLEGLLRDMGASEVVDAVRRAQGGGTPAGLAGSAAGSMAPAVSVPSSPGRTGVGDVRIRPVPAPARPARAWTRVSPAPRYTGAAPAGAAGGGTVGPGPGGFARSPVGAPVATGRAGPPAGGPPAPGAAPPPGPGVVAGVAVWPEVRTLLLRLLHWWAARHATMARTLVTSGRRRAGLRALGFCLVVDVVFAVIAAIFAAMVIAPVLGL